MKEDYFRTKKSNPVVSFWLPIIFIVTLLGIATKMTLDDKKKRNEIIQKQTHVWIMDDSCSEQLLNSTDGIIRIKVTK